MTWRDAASPGNSPEYRPNDAFRRALAAKAQIDQQKRG